MKIKYRDLDVEIDEFDLDKLLECNWSPRKVTRNHNIYLYNHKRGPIHRFILGVTDRSVAVDHINGNTLDNRRENLRLATNKENCRNASKWSRKPTSSQYKGVCREIKNGKTKFVAYIYPDGKTVKLGRFDDERDAAAAYNDAASRLYGEFARLNVIAQDCDFIT